MSNHKSSLKEHMSGTDRRKLGDLPTTHRNCIEKTGVARPGKTSRDKARGSWNPDKNIRVQDTKTKRWIRQRDGAFVS